jgi:hypothetical protein
MKNLTIIFTLVLALASCNGKAENKLKRYELKSGIVEYVTTTSGKVLGSTVSGGGTDKLFFKDWGALELKESVSSQTSVMKIFGREKTEKTDTHTINKLDNGDSYSVDFKNKKIYQAEDMAMEMVKNTHPEGDAGDVGRDMLVAMGGKMIGNENFKSYKCEVWEILGGKQWIYKGLMLKMEITVLGITTITEATSIKFDVSVADSHFKLPDFPIEKTETFINNDDSEIDSKEMKEGMKAMENLTYPQWKKMVIEGDPEMKNTSDEELRQSYDMMQKMLKLQKGR